MTREAERNRNPIANGTGSNDSVGQRKANYFLNLGVAAIQGGYGSGRRRNTREDTKGEVVRKRINLFSDPHIGRAMLRKS
jgi:hypothetical protein